MNDEFKQLINTDEKLVKDELPILQKSNDPNHYERRKQQRAITKEMVTLCLSYGEKKRIRGALTYTILDKNLKGTRYQKYLSELRGLRVVLNKLNENSLGIHTVYWVDSVRKK